MKKRTCRDCLELECSVSGYSKNYYCGAGYSTKPIPTKFQWDEMIAPAEECPKPKTRKEWRKLIRGQADGTIADPRCPLPDAGKEAT